MSEVVLIADSDAVRGKRIATACSARGMACSLTSHGAGALEIALADSPVAMVAQVDLPLIDGLRLSEILRANPRTRDLAVLFVGDRAPDGAERDGPGRMVPGHADPETIARFVEALLAKRRSLRDGRRSESGSGVEGQLDQLSLCELLEVFHLNRRSGVVELRRSEGGRRGPPGTVHLCDGQIVQAAVGPVTGEKALFRLMSWDRGSFAFCAGPVNVERGIERSTGVLLREGRRQAAELEKLAVDLPPRHASVTLEVSRASLPNVMHPLTQEVLLVLELSTRVQDVLDRCSHPDLQVLRTLHTLVRRGMVELRRQSPRAEAGEGGSPDALLAPAQVARLRDWLDRGRARGCALPDAKLLVVGSDPDALRGLSAALARLPGAEPAEPAQEAALGPLGRLAVDEEIGIDLIACDPGDRFAPLWPLAAHGALAVLLVHAGSADESLGRLAAAWEVTRTLPRSRVFHLHLFDESGDEAGGSAVLRERLHLADDDAFASACRQSPDAAVGALRQLLVKMLP